MRIHDPETRHFASDNYAGVHPEVLVAIAEANGGHQVSYGADAYTARLQEVVKGHFGEAAEAFPVFNGTGANVIALTSMLPRWGAVITASTAHINTDENGAPERISGIKLLPVDTPDGKLTPALIDRHAGGRGDEHRAQPLVVSITQSTELGTVYSPGRTPRHLRSRPLARHARAPRRGPPRECRRPRSTSPSAPSRAMSGVDVVSLGGTKNGLLYGEAIVVLSPAASVGLPFLRKYTMQLSSKMRFASAQLLALLEGDLWLRSARHANAMAARLRAGLERSIADGHAAGLRFTQPSDANAIFVALPASATAVLRQRHHFYDWNAATGEVRWMTSFDTTEADIDGFIADVIAALE
jgi:threonine aldolase